MTVCGKPPNISHSQASLDLSGDKASPEKAVTPPKTSSILVEEEPGNEPDQPIIQDTEASETNSSPASDKTGSEDTGPVACHGREADVINGSGDTSSTTTVL